MNSSFWRMAAVAVLTLALFNMSLISSAQAGVIGTEALVSTDRDTDLASVRSQLERADVRTQMAKMGVDPVNIDQRVAALSDSELHRLAQDMQRAPAGGDGVLAVLGVVFLVLLILEVTGVIDIFKRHPR